MRTAKERVDLILEHGMEDVRSWIGVKGYRGPDGAPSGGDAWEKEYHRLLQHHEDESKALLDVIRELASRLQRSSG